MEKIVKRFTSVDKCHNAIADCIENHSNTLLMKNDNYTLALSGGRTPVGLFNYLHMHIDRHPIQWGKFRFFWSDERFLPLSDPDSNFLMAEDNLLSHIPVPEDHIYKPPTDNANHALAAAQYEQMILDAFSKDNTENFVTLNGRVYPRFDLIMLGIGTDGHTASLFPEHSALQDTGLVVGVESKYAKPQVPRLTFTLPLINSADTVIFMVNGNDKLDLIESFIDSTVPNSSIPASMVAPQNRLIWFVVT